MTHAQGLLIPEQYRATYVAAPNTGKLYRWRAFALGETVGRRHAKGSASQPTWTERSAQQPAYSRWRGVIYEMKPHTCCMENVPEIATMTTPEGLPVLDVFAIIIDKGVSYMEAVRQLADGAEVKPFFPRTTRKRPKTRRRKAKAEATDQGELF